MTQTDPTIEVPFESEDVEVEETVRTRVNPDGTLTKITEIRKPNGVIRVVEETTQRDGRKTVTVKEFAANTEPGSNAAGNFQQPPPSVQHPSRPTNYPPASVRVNHANQHPATYPPPVHQPRPTHGPIKRVDSEEEMCCGEFPRFNAPAECRPTKHPLAKEGMIQWAWCPTFSWLRVIFITSWLLTALGLVMIVAGAFGNVGLLIAGIIFFIGGIIMTFIFGVWKWNADKQGAYKIARGKRVEAMALWKDIDPQFHYQAKDKFYETRYGGKVLRVLRDGTIEIEGTHRNAGGSVEALEAATKMSGNAAEMASNVQGMADISGV